MRSTLPIALVLPITLAAPVLAHDDPPPGSGVWPSPREEIFSPPGWFGPGPARGAWRNVPSPGVGWQYYGVPDGPTVVNPPSTRVGVGVGVGYGFGPFGAWGYPAATRSFWSNGLSLYGPPVPTYSPIPGVFGAGDAGKHFFRNPPPTAFFRFGVGWLGSRSPSPRPHPLSVTVYPPPAPSVQVLPGVPATTADGAPCLRLSVHVPDPTAEVWIEKTAMTQRGADRSFESPPLEAGKTYKYEIVARWKENGQDRAESRTVLGTPGQTVRVDFSRPDEALAAK